MPSREKTNILYMSYMGISEPLLYSQALAYLKGLSLKGYNIFILSFEKRENLDNSFLAQINKELFQYKISWFPLKYHKKPQITAKLFDVIIGVFSAFIICAKYRIGIIHVRNTICAIMAWPAKFILGRKLVFDLRGLMADEYIDGNLWKKKGVVYKVLTRLEAFFLINSEALVVLTRKIRLTLAARHKNISLITIIPTCVDLDAFKPDLKKKLALRKQIGLTGRFIMVYVGSIGTWYLFDEMLRFFRCLLLVKTNAFFMVISQSQSSLIESQIPQDLRFAIMHKRLNPSDVPDYVNMSDVGISFIKSCYSKTASSPTKFGEYLGSGLPVIINSGIGDTAEIVSENAIGAVLNNFTPTEYDAAIHRMDELLSDRESLSLRCRQAAEKYFSLKTGIEEYHRIYSRMI